MESVDITADISTPQIEREQQQQTTSSERKGPHVIIKTRTLLRIYLISFISFTICKIFLDLTETLEMRESLQKQLQEIMSATKLTSGRRASSRLARAGSGGVDSPNTPEILGRMGRRSRTLEALRYPQTPHCTY